MTDPDQNGGRLRVAWLCGAYEPGCDGVGDYVRRIAPEFLGQGQTEPAVVALRDGYVREPSETRATLRLPLAASRQQNIAQAGNFLDRRNTGLLAWNFVPQMFAPRGLISKALAADYARLAHDRRLILFMHELWCGTGREDTWRNWLTGVGQRPGVLRWLELHRPACVLTSIAAYAAVLQHAGIPAAVVPLCSNIRRIGGVDRSRWPAALAGHELARESRAGYILAGVFGAIHPIWQPEQALVQLAAYARRVGKKLAVVWFGRGSPVAEECWRRVGAAVGPDIRFARLGPLAEPPASELIESCDLGLPTLQFNLLGKSGTAAAFVEHGVPLLVVSDAWWPRFSGFEQGAPVDSVALWTRAAPVDWEKLLAARTQPGDRMEECLAGWRRALTGLAGKSPSAGPREVPLLERTGVPPAPRRRKPNLTQ